MVYYKNVLPRLWAQLTKNILATQLGLDFVFF